MAHMRDAMKESCCMLGERMWDGARVVDTLRFMIDTGASTHMTNDKHTFIDGTMVECESEVMGVSGAITRMTHMGSVSIVVGADITY